MASTPAMFMTTVDLRCDGAVQITASHHPCHRNGLKFFRARGRPGGRDIEAILENAQEGRSCAARQTGRKEETDYMTAYASRLRRLIVEGVDAGNGRFRVFISWWTRVTARGASTPRRCWSLWARIFPAVSFWSRTAVSPPYPQSGERGGHGLRLRRGKGTRRGSGRYF